VTVVTDILGDAVHNPTTGSEGDILMPLSALVPFVLVAVIGIVVFCAVYRAGA
jgi:hypothetical protein